MQKKGFLYRFHSVKVTFLIKITFFLEVCLPLAYLLLNFAPSKTSKENQYEH